MKRIATYISGTALLRAGLCISCQKESVIEKAGTNSTDGDRITVTATIEQVQPQTRTALSDADGVTVSWSAGDQVDINGATYSAKISGKGEAILTYESGVAPKEGPYTAVYPASLCKTEGHDRVIEFPNVQCYEPDKLNSPMYVTSDTDELTFHNICGVICFSLTGAEKIRGIYVSAKDHPLYGTVTVDAKNYIAKVDAQYKKDQKETQVLANNKIILDCGTDGVQLSEKPTKFYMYLPETTFGAVVGFDNSKSNYTGRSVRLVTEVVDPELK